MQNASITGRKPERALDGVPFTPTTASIGTASIAPSPPLPLLDRHSFGCVD